MTSFMDECSDLDRGWGSPATFVRGTARNERTREHRKAGTLMAPRGQADRVHTLMIILGDTRPKVWRRVEVLSASRLSDLHRLIRTVMGWENMSLHVFVFSGRAYSDSPRPDSEPFGIDESTVRIGDVLRHKGSAGTYTYDPDDKWLHTLAVEEIGDAVPGTAYPRLLGGQGGPPPDGCGGVWAFDRLRRLRDRPEEVENAGGDKAEDLHSWVEKLEPDDLDMEAERRRVRDAFGTLPLEQAEGAGTDFWPSAVPARPVFLPSEEELARAAGGTEALDETLRLARWFTPARELTSTGMPRPADARTVVVEQELLRPVSEHEATERCARLEKLRAAKNLPGFLRLWHRAVNLGLIEVGPSGARTAPEVVDGLSPARALELWTTVFEEVLESEPDGTGVFQAVPDESNVLPALLRMLYEAPDDSGIGLHELAETLFDPTAYNQEFSTEALRIFQLTSRATVYRCVLRLSWTGALALTDRTPAKVSELAWQGSLWGRLLGEAAHGHAPDPGIDCSVTLTPLGSYGVRQALLREGVPAPFEGHWAEAGAAELLDALMRVAPENHQGEFMPWLERRTASEAVEQIVEAAAGSPEASAVRRVMAQHILMAIGDQGLKDLRAYLDSADAAVAGLAANVLLGSETCSEEEAQQLISEHGPWLAIDMAAAQMEVGAYTGSNGDERLSILIGLLIDEGSVPGTIGGLLLEGTDRLWRSGHPATVPVLQALGRVHPDKKRAKAARRAAHRAQSRG